MPLCHPAYLLMEIYEQCPNLSTAKLREEEPVVLRSSGAILFVVFDHGSKAGIMIIHSNKTVDLVVHLKSSQTIKFNEDSWSTLSHPCEFHSKVAARDEVCMGMLVDEC